MYLQFYARDGGRKHRPQHVELIRYKSIEIVASFWLSIVITRLSIGNQHWEAAEATGKLSKTVLPAVRSFRQHFPNSHREARSSLFCLTLVCFVQRIENCVLYLRNPGFGPRP